MAELWSWEKIGPIGFWLMSAVPFVGTILGFGTRVLQGMRAGVLLGFFLGLVALLLCWDGPRTTILVLYSTLLGAEVGATMALLVGAARPVPCWLQPLWWASVGAGLTGASSAAAADHLFLAQFRGRLMCNLGLGGARQKAFELVLLAVILGAAWGLAMGHLQRLRFHR
jgi:hypothetical protein